MFPGLDSLQKGSRKLVLEFLDRIGALVPIGILEPLKGCFCNLFSEKILGCVFREGVWPARAMLHRSFHIPATPGGGRGGIPLCFRALTPLASTAKKTAVRRIPRFFATPLSTGQSAVVGEPGTTVATEADRQEDRYTGATAGSYEAGVSGDWERGSYAKDFFYAMPQRQELCHKALCDKASPGSKRGTSQGR
jgi:hypothetical protein